ncbi:MAG: DarT ssDNA thymidine ADP-ribosyltransferase family protein [Cetobacterium sp.]|uniref:DarT ssDNA thymidine ADP-ribosyltransferase family protein n=1 Tax=Cetobacterium sp. TaxID=2071632 RepID=UPI003F35FB6C
MKIKTTEDLVSILYKIIETLKNNSYEISLLKYLNNDSPFYQIEGFKNNDNLILKIYLKKDGTKTIQFVNHEEIFENLIFKKCENYTFKILIKKDEIENIELKLLTLKKIKILNFELDSNNSIELYNFKIKCLNENYRINLKIFSTGTILMQGANSDFFNLIIDYLFYNKEKIIIKFNEYNKNLNKLIENMQDSIFQRFLNKKQLSKEQLCIVESQENFIVINAIAGSGKTTTLEGVINKWNQKRILYIVYNKKMKEEAEYRFKEYQNVKIVTSHSMAYEKYSLRNTKENLDIFQLAKEFKISFQDASFLSKAFQLYLTSKIISKKEFIDTKKEILKKIFFKECDIEKNLIKKFNKIMENLLELFKRLINLIELKKIPEIHDYYLKKFQLYEDKIYKYEIVMLDEAQDSNEVVMDIIETKFPNARKIIVGDTHQQIYSWRGAVNAMKYFSQLSGAKLFNLTTSYRIGQDLADICMELLSMKNTNVSILGENKNQQKKSQINIFENNTTTLTILFRKNFNMMKNALYTNKKICFLKDINLEKYLDIKFFKEGNIKNIKHLKILKKYKSYNQLIEHIKAGWIENNDIIMGVQLFEYLGNSFEESLNELNSRIISSKELKKNNPSEVVILGTIHSSKGCEFENLLLSSDYLNFIDNIERMSVEEIEEEINLIYVGLTRTCKNISYILDLNFLKKLIEPYFRTKSYDQKVENENIKRQIYRDMIYKIIQEREIKEIIHFTQMSNLKNILNYGLCSVEYLEKKNISFIQNDFVRLDDRYDYISVSVSFPNYKMLYCKRNETLEPYVVISIKPEILLDKQCLFFSTNAANHKFQNELIERSNPSNLEEFFDIGLNDLPKNYPLDPQAEILIKDIIETNYINCIYLEKNDFNEKRANYIHPNAKHIKFLLGQKYFEKRSW